MLSNTFTFIAALLVITLCSFTSTALTTDQQTDVKLVLIGIAVDGAQEPINGASVVLLDEITQKTQQFTTKVDGHFYFRLEPDKRYRVSLVSDSGTPVDSKTVNTSSKDSPEIIHAVLKSGVDISSSQTAEYTVKRSPSYSMPSMPK